MGGPPVLAVVGGDRAWQSRPKDLQLKHDLAKAKLP